MAKKYKTDKERFSELLDNYPRLAGYWDRSHADPWQWECDIERVRATGGALSRGEDVILSILVSIWLGGLRGEAVADFKIDFTDLYGLLDPRDRSPLMGWLSDPFWP